MDYPFDPFNVSYRIERNIRWFLDLWLGDCINGILLDRKCGKQRIGDEVISLEKNSVLKMLIGIYITERDRDT